MNFIESNLEGSGLDKTAATEIMTASEEIIVNVIHYAYPHNAGNIKIGYDHEPDRIIVTVTDGGIPFNPLERPEVDTSLSIDERQEGGLGIFMAKNMTDEIIYEYKDSKNCLSLIKYISQ